MANTKIPVELSSTPGIVDNSNATAITIDSSENVGIGDTSPDNKLQISDSSVGTDVTANDSNFIKLTNKDANTVNEVWGLGFSTESSGTDYLGGFVQALGDYTSNFNTSLIFGTRGTSGNAATRMTIDSSGNVGIGLTPLYSGNGTARPSLEIGGSTEGNLAFNGTGKAGLIITNSKNIGGTFKAAHTGLASAYGQTAGEHIWYTAASVSAGSNQTFNERMRITSSGNLLVNNTSALDAKLVSQGSGTTSGGYSIVCANSSGGTAFFARNDGVINTGVLTNSPYNLTIGSAANCFINSDGTLYRSTSSRRYKNTITDATHGLTELLTLRPVTYKGNGDADGDTVYGGLIAEEVHDAGLTEFVVYNEEGEPDALAYSNMVSLCIKAIQEQQTLIESLEARITALES